MPSTRRPSTPAPPAELVKAILSGNCIAFVGAGFSRPGGVRLWSELILELAHDELRPGRAARRFIDTLLKGRSPSAHELDQAAQVLEDALGTEPFRRHLVEHVRAARWNRQMHERVRLLRGIPFRAVLTTNYDQFLRAQPKDLPFEAVLRARRRAWLHRLLEATSGKWTTPVLKLHGDIAEPKEAVLTRRDYRRRVYESPGYTNFLRSVMASYTVLYLGFSFTDAYLNELRSEVMSMLEHGPSGNAEGRGATPNAFALVADVDPQKAAYFKRHEGVRVVSYPTRGSDHSAFDGFLSRLHDATNPVTYFARHIAGRRILWADPRPDEHARERAILDAVCSESEVEPATVLRERDHRKAVERAQEGDLDLVLTSWGEPSNRFEGEAPGPWLMRELRRRGIEVPVIVFSRRKDPERRLLAVRLGAHAHATSWEELFPAISRVLAPAAEL